MRNQSFQNVLISLFVVFWLLIFNYESTRHFYLEPLLDRPLPKVRLLFPPAGWIMFFNVDERFGYAEIYGIKDNIPQPIDPHQILETRAIGYDNIYRNVLSTVLSRYYQRPFCRYLDWKFPYFDSFAVTQVYYPSVTQSPQKRYQQVVYECP